MEAGSISVKEKSAALFKYIRELSNIRQNTVYNAADYDFCGYLSALPDDGENIAVSFRDRTGDAEADEQSDQALLAVTKPEFDAAPEPDMIFADWLRDGWDDFRKEPELYDTLPDDLSETPEIFGSDRKRAAAFAGWRKRRDKWAARQKTIEKTRDLFTGLYQIHARLERESETLEMIAANGFIRSASNPAVCHPVLTKRVKTSFSAKMNTVSVEDADSDPAIETTVFHAVPGINLDKIPDLRAELEENGYHPFDRNDAAEFLKRLAHTLTSESVFSDGPAPAGWESRGDLLICMTPAFIVRRRISGASGMTARVIETIETTGYIPDHIADIVSGGTGDAAASGKSDTIDRLLADASGEDADIYLAKEANREQLEIARRIENYSGVLVQGPPGTGKTHTIANLTGHFLAQGKTVLITSHTKKALSVLKDKLPSGMRSLCVSVLDDSSRDMEKSVDGITDYMSKYTSHDLEKETDTLASRRSDVIASQSETRKRIFDIICRENEQIDLNGEKLTPSEAALFISSNPELGFIPGPVRAYAPLPLGYDRLAELYRTNDELSGEDEPELECGLPSPGELPDPAEFADTVSQLEAASDSLADRLDELGWEASSDPAGNITVVTPLFICRAEKPDDERLAALEEKLRSFETVRSWMKNAAIDGRKGGAFRQRWTVLTDQIAEANRLAERVMVSGFGRTISYSESVPRGELRKLVEKLRDHYQAKGKVSKLDLMLNGDIKRAVSSVSVDGREPMSADECGMILDALELERQDSLCEGYWNSLMREGGAPAYSDLDPKYPIQATAKWRDSILRWLDWYEKDLEELSASVSEAGLDPEQFFYSDPLEPESEEADRLTNTIKTTLAHVVGLCRAVIAADRCGAKMREADAALRSGKRASSSVCAGLRDAIEKQDTDEYRRLYRRAEALYAKYDVQTRRASLLGELAAYAPKWADEIRYRIGVHGKASLPPDIGQAWKYRQLSEILASIVGEPLGELMKKNAGLSSEYRSVTAAFAEKSAWARLISRTESDIDMRQALQGWKQTIRKIGKGTGKNAARLRAEARRLMSKCQQAVPAWIMPVSKAMESLDPAVNRFDIIIIDEASQSDISALSVMYMAKKVIIVGDDRQVSPMAVGVETDTLNNLSQMYIKGVIPNWQLYDAKTSLYDIAATTFQPLMLREHFRCVPEIIGFSNMLSYDGRIMPLRDSGGGGLTPAVINCRVDGGKRDARGKTNEEEARTVTALLRACLETPEYSGRTFGVISLLGDEQAKLINRMIYENIDIRDIDSRQILCGNASNFQGDERDVIFLSVVDSAVSVDGEISSPLKTQGFGADDSIRKRYNVAVSRARDQLWVISSLDPSSDLKAGDIRKTLIDYAADPDAFTGTGNSRADSASTPLEKEIARRLAEMGYNVESGRRVGGYILDMAVTSGRSSAAIECTGASGMTGSDAVSYESRLDMERQTILERIGWNFIRVRGSEYYLDREKVMKTVVSRLKDLGITPGKGEKNTAAINTAEKVKEKAAAILLSAGYPSQAGEVIPV